MQIIILAIVLVAIAIGGIAIKMFLKPGGTFTKTCGSATNPKTGKPMPCSCKSEKPEECDYSTDSEKDNNTGK